MATLLGTLGIGITADLAGLAKGLETASKSLTDFGQKTEKMGKSISETGTTMTKWATGPIVAVGAAVTALAVNVGQFADNLMTQSLQTGLSAKSLQEWRYIATLCGVSADAAVTAIYGLSRRMAELENDTGEGAEALAKLGLTFEDIRGKSPEDVFTLLLDRLSTIPDVLERNSIASKTLGLGWKEVAPIIAAGGDEIERLREEAHDLGVVISDEGIKAAADFDNAWDSITAQLAAAKNEMGISLAPMMRNTFVPIIQNTVIPALKDFGEKLAAIIKWFGDLPESTQKTIIKVVALVAAVGPAVLIVGKLTTAVGLLSKALGAFMANPILLGLAAIAAATIAVVSKFAEARQTAAELEQEYIDLGAGLFEASGTINSALEQMSNGVGMLDHMIGEVAFDDLIAKLDELKIAVLDLPADEIEAAWTEGVDQIFDALESEYPKLEKILERYRRGFLEKGEEMAEDLISGFSEQASQFVAAVSDTVSAGLGAAANATEGFAAVGTKAGESFAEGLSIGLAETASAVDQSLSAVGQDALAAFDVAGKLIAEKSQEISAQIAATYQMILDDSADTARKIAQGYTPTFDELQTKVNSAVVAFEMARQTYGESSIEALNAFKQMLTVQAELNEINKDLWETLQQVNGPLLNLIVYMKQYTGAMEEDEAFMRKFIEQQSTLPYMLEKIGAGIDLTGIHWDDYVRITRKASEETKTATDEIDAAVSGLDGPFTYARSVILSWGDVISELAQRTVPTAVEALRSMQNSISSAFSTFFDGISEMKTTNAELKEDYENTLIELADAEGEAYKKAAEQRTKELQDLSDDLSDGKITREQYTREAKQIEADFTKAVKQAAEARTKASEEELLAYEAQRRGVDDILSEMLKSFLKAAREQLQLEAAKWAVIAIAEGIALNFIGALKAAGAAAAYLAGAAGLAIAGFEKGGVVKAALGEPVPAIVHGGEAVFTPDQLAALGTIDYGLLGEAVHAGVYDAMDELGIGADRPLILQVDGKTFGRIALPLVQREKVRLGLEAV
ncbi:MAG: hypothetical protein WC565_07190 [Parcubacteria group bacterium]